MWIIMIPEKDIIIKDYDGVTDFSVYQKGKEYSVWDGRGSNCRVWGRFRRMVFRRDGFKCVQCGESNIKTLRVHHIVPVHTNPNLYYDVDNAVSMCDNCHKPTIPKSRRGEIINPIRSD